MFNFFNEGSIINGILVEEIIIERCYCEFFDVVSLKASIEFSPYKPVIYILIFRNQEKYYLYLDEADSDVDLYDEIIVKGVNLYDGKYL